ncbi:uncharacterized protein (DUF2236 family) [Rathayibacter sp. PhB152]|uniref:oxygenase MpaB family protein n=1 Tax=Rathayibacter sp. PhB152 TaxID=2485190 RepID=UPI000F4D234D|nr:oxygenase MpaB family protein [Rathayibacter sp. PhB152]ROQ58796.1 uncharacterized protein (DUF2236 family) [Rathayibacter sp. PhB152]
MSRRRPRPRPDWVAALETGDDAGLFGPGSAVWAVNGAMPTMVAGVRALLMQTLHAGAMAGVHDHSRYREDPMGRLDNTVRWVLTTSFGDTATTSGAARWVTGVHERIVGTYQDAADVERHYSAQDPRLLLWVHDAFTDAFLGAHQLWGGPIPGGADAYVREWAASGRLLGVENPPESVAELREQLAGFAGELRPDERVHEAVEFLRTVKLPGEAGVIYPLLFAGATASLSPEVRRLLGLRRPWWPAITATRLLMRSLEFYLGRVSPSERAARTRLGRLAATRTAAS